MKLKAITVTVITCVLLSGGVVNARECPLPEANTDAEITFNGFEWYSDYTETKDHAKEIGITSFLDSFDPRLSSTAHWTIVRNPGNYYSDCEKDCGGYMYCSGMPQVAGYDIDHVMLYFILNNSESYGLADYEKDHAIEFYMGVYTFDASDQEYCYNDLAEKLKGLYGNTPTVEENCMYWVNGDGAMLGLSNGGVYGISLMYMAPGAEEKLCEVEKIALENEKLNAEGDVSGL